MGWLVHGEESENSAVTEMENLTRLEQELALISIIRLPVCPFIFLRYILQRDAGQRHSPHGSKPQSIEWLNRICALLCSMMHCQCFILNVTVDWHLIHASPMCSTVAVSSLRPSNTKHAFPSRH